jgi:hypothetical protein
MGHFFSERRSMAMTRQGHPVALAVLFAALSAVGWTGQSAGAGDKDVPVGHLESTSHVLAPVFEGEPLSYSFEVFNRGGAELRITRVSPS